MATTNAFVKMCSMSC